MALQPQNERPFGFRDKLGYLFGDFGNDFTFIFAGSYLTLFYTDVLGVSAGLVGVLFVVARSGITVCVPSAAVRNKNNGVAAAMIRFASMAPTLRNVESDARMESGFAL